LAVGEVAALRSAIRTLRGWAIQVLQEASAIHECEEHGRTILPQCPAE
jgi:hypothetical protein